MDKLDQEENLDRKNFLSALAAVFSVPFAISFLTGCDQKAPEISGRTREPTDVEPGEAELGDPDFECPQPNTLNRESADTDIPLALVPNVKVYKNQVNATVAIAVPGYGHGGSVNLSSILLLKTSGEMIGLKTVSRADIGSDNTLRPVVFENVNFKEDDKMSLVMVTTDSKQYLFDVGKSVKFETTFRKLPVEPVWNTANGAFSPEMEYSPDPDITVELERANDFWLQSFFTLGPNAKFSSLAALSGAIVTDMAGSVLAEDGANFIDIGEYPQFIIYRPVDGKFERSIVTIG